MYLCINISLFSQDFFICVIYVGVHRCIDIGMCVCGTHVCEHVYVWCETRSHCQVPPSIVSHLVFETGSLTGSVTLTNQRVPPLGYKHKSPCLVSAGC